MFQIPFHDEGAQSAQAMADQMGGENRIAPVIVVLARCRARHAPAGQRRAGFSGRAIAQKKHGDAAFACRESQPPTGHKVQALGHALDFQKQRAHMRTSQDVAGR